MRRSGLGGDGKPWRIGTEVYDDHAILPRDVISRKLSVPNAERIFPHALRAGFTIEEIFNLTKIDRWFLVQSEEIADFVAARASGLNHAQEINMRRTGLVVGVHHAHVMGATGLEFEFQPRIPSVPGVVVAGEQAALGVVKGEQ